MSFTDSAILPATAEIKFPQNAGLWSRPLRFRVITKTLPAPVVLPESNSQALGSSASESGTTRRGDHQKREPPQPKAQAQQSGLQGVALANIPDQQPRQAFFR